MYVKVWLSVLSIIVPINAQSALILYTRDLSVKHHQVIANHQKIQIRMEIKHIAIDLIQFSKKCPLYIKRLVFLLSGPKQQGQIQLLRNKLFFFHLLMVIYSYFSSMTCHRERVGVAMCPSGFNQGLHSELLQKPEGGQQPICISNVANFTPSHTAPLLPN